MYLFIYLFIYSFIIYLLCVICLFIIDLQACLLHPSPRYVTVF